MRTLRKHSVEGFTKLEECASVTLSGGAMKEVAMDKTGKQHSENDSGQWKLGKRRDFTTNDGTRHRPRSGLGIHSIYSLLG
jgi:hypothetical protein